MVDEDINKKMKMRREDIIGATDKPSPPKPPAPTPSPSNAPAGYAGWYHTPANTQDVAGSTSGPGVGVSTSAKPRTTGEASAAGNLQALPAVNKMPFGLATDIYGRSIPDKTAKSTLAGRTEFIPGAKTETAPKIKSALPTQVPTLPSHDSSTGKTSPPKALDSDMNLPFVSRDNKGTPILTNRGDKYTPVAWPGRENEDDPNRIHYGISQITDPETIKNIEEVGKRSSGLMDEALRMREDRMALEGAHGVDEANQVRERIRHRNLEYLSHKYDLDLKKLTMQHLASQTREANARADLYGAKETSLENKPGMAEKLQLAKLRLTSDRKLYEEDPNRLAEEWGIPNGKENPKWRARLRQEMEQREREVFDGGRNPEAPKRDKDSVSFEQFKANAMNAGHSAEEAEQLYKDWREGKVDE